MCISVTGKHCLITKWKAISLINHMPAKLIRNTNFHIYSLTSCESYKIDSQMLLNSGTNSQEQYASKNDMVTECLTHIRFTTFWTELSEQSLLKYQKETLWGFFKKPSLIKDYVVHNLSGFLVLNNPALHHWLEDNLKELFNSLKFDFLLRFTVLTSP